MIKTIDLQEYAARAQRGELTAEEEMQLVSYIHRLVSHNCALRMDAEKTDAAIEAMRKEQAARRAIMDRVNGFAPATVDHKHFVSGMEASHPEQELQ